MRPTVFRNTVGWEESFLIYYRDRWNLSNLYLVIYTGKVKNMISGGDMIKNIMKLLFMLVVIMFFGIGFSNVNYSKAMNSYLPHWEHIPDGEPRLFEDPDNPGKYRVYIYGSHDTRKTEYCGYDLVTWSAPVENLNNWRYEGIIFESVVNGNADVLFAPDVVETKDEDGNKVYYLYPNNQSGGRGGMIARSDSPKGPFEVCNWKNDSHTQADGVLGFDPAVLVDDDGRVYGYWGFQNSFMAELDPETMCTVKEGCKILDVNDTGIDGCGNGDTFRFFEASSIRKVGDKYVFVYSRSTNDGEFGLGSSNCTLAYAYGDSPLGPWTYGGTVVDARGRETDSNGKVICAQQSWGNTHGSILEINGQWYVFYHRCIDNSMYSRQAMVEPIDVKVTEDGKVEITEAEVTSQGFEINGLNPYKMQTAGSACFITGGPQVEAHYDESNAGSNVINIKGGSIVGYKYLNFDAYKGNRDKDMIAVELIPKGKDGTVEIMLDRPWESDGGTLIGTIDIYSDDDTDGVIKTADIDSLSQIKGKHALYFIFKGGSSTICDLKMFQFGGSNFEEIPEPSPTPVPDVTKTPAETAKPTAAPTILKTPNPPDITKPVVGKSYVVGGIVYKVNKANTVTVTGTKNKKIKNINIPDIITINGEKFRVTAIGKSAFKGCRAVRVVIGKNVTQIGSNAFQSCKRLKYIKINSKVLKKAGKNAWKGIHAKAEICVPKKQLSKYKKFFKSSQGIKKIMKIRVRF